MDASFESLDVGLNWSTHRRQGTSKGSGEAFKRKMDCGWHEERRGVIQWEGLTGIESLAKCAEGELILKTLKSHVEAYYCSPLLNYT